ncbi:Thioredoxin reductase 1, mitochondrial [Frankliniella fusca]|uniref:Thioredoxin reductase 1, mitochondrial n=1 Tax=Frankliniella fusca TaxID=407009 RepID=A0AAE1I1S1_9NEOP|nr:Thioredoxin reductase 1, mitochondrial [Frankliniella fusca]
MLALHAAVFIHSLLRLSVLAAQGVTLPQEYITTEWSIGGLDLEAEGWALEAPGAGRTTSRSPPGPPGDGDGDGKRGRKAFRAPGAAASTAATPPATGQEQEGQGGGGESRPNYFLTVTVPWTAGMLALFLVFLWLMRTDGPVYHCLTKSYTPPAVREQAAEERRRERLEETERNAQHAWDHERARWRKERPSPSPTPSASTSASPHP